MKFEKGNTLSNGRPKGALNKTNQQIKDVIDKVTTWINDEDRLEQMLANIAESKPEVFLNFIAKVAPKDIHLDIQAKEKNPVLENMIKIRKELEEKRKKPKIIEIKQDK